MCGIVSAPLLGGYASIHRPQSLLADVALQVLLHGVLYGCPVTRKMVLPPMSTPWSAIRSR